MAKFYIKGCLGGGFGGVKNQDWEEIEVDDLDDATNEAFEKACECYESYEGLYGLRTIHEIMEEDGEDEECALEIYREERDGWLDYLAISEEDYINLKDE